MPFSLDQDGFETAATILSKDEVEDLRLALSAMKVAPGHRNLMRQVPEVAALAVSPKIINLLGKKLGTKPFPVRSIFFGKTPEANWLVPWHQDISIAVDSRIELVGYGPWSTKDGVLHVQPPVEVLKSMVAVRVHLDDCDATNGPLRVIPGSHQGGKLHASQVAQARKLIDEVTCCLNSGDALIMRPLLLHASSQAFVAGHRRVIHLEYAVSELPEGLEWAESVAD